MPTQINTNHLWCQLNLQSWCSRITGLFLIMASNLSMVQAATLTVINLNDSGPGSLRQAILDTNNAPGANTIAFQSDVRGTITLTGGELPITNNLVIEGPGANVLGISGNNNSGVFHISGAITVTIRALAVQDGHPPGDRSPSPDGAGILNDRGTLIVENCLISGNSSRGNGGGIGSAGGKVTIINSTLSDNSAQLDAGGAGSGSSGTLIIINSTLSGNHAGGRGGGIRNWNGENQLSVSNSTLSGNRASDCGGGIANDGAMTIADSLVSGNTAPTGNEICNSATFSSQGHNLFGTNGDSGVTNASPQASDLVLTGALETAIGSLANNGGPTPTHLPVTGSPAIDAGDNALIPAEIATDQRGYGPRIVNGTVDIGAVEVGATGPDNHDEIVMSLEEPADGSVYSGIANVRGWAVAPSGMQRVELYVDSQLFSNVPLGGRRADVGGAYPSYPGSADSGYAMAFNYSGLAAGSHTFTARAYDASGGAHDASAIVNVVRFASPYIADPAAIDLDQATLARSGHTLTLQNLRAEGQPYTVRLAWRPAVQGFAIDRIDALGRSAPDLRQESNNDPTSAPVAASIGPNRHVATLSAAAASNSIVMSLEEPADGSVYSGIANVRGWAVAPSGMQRVELYVDSQLFSNVPLGGRRADVGGAYPSYPGSADSGYAMAFNYSGLAAGSHTFTARAYDASGGAHDASAIVNVVRFASPYIADPAAIDLDQATLARSGHTLTLQNLRAEGQPYTVRLAWRPAVQGFAIDRIDSAVDCTYAISPTIISMVPVQGGNGRVDVTTQSGCSWTARSTTDWITVTAGTSGTGSGTVTYSVSNNPSNASRTGTLTIADQTLRVSQDHNSTGK